MGEVKRYVADVATCVDVIPTESVSGAKFVLAADYAALEAENAKLRAELERRTVDAITMADVMRAWEYAEDHPHKYLRGTTNWCAAVAHSLNQQRVAAPSAPKADDPVKGSVPDVECRRLLFAFGLECNTIGLNGAAENLHKGMKAASSAAIAAARKGEEV